MVPRSSEGATYSYEAGRSAGWAWDTCDFESVDLVVLGLLVRGFEETVLGGTSSACDCSGDAEDAARLSRSSRRRLSFLPTGS